MLCRSEKVLQMFLYTTSGVWWYTVMQGSDLAYVPLHYFCVVVVIGMQGTRLINVPLHYYCVVVVRHDAWHTPSSYSALILVCGGTP